MKLVFVTFGGSIDDAINNNFSEAVNRICKQAEQFELFDEIFGFKREDIMNDIPFWEIHSKFILNNPRGFGYWIWKGHLIKKIMDQLDYNDIILYADCGCELNILGKNKLIHYIELANRYNILTFQLINYCEKNWTKMDLLKYFNCTKHTLRSGQICATTFFIKKTPLNIAFLIELNNLYIIDNYHFLDDSPSITQNIDTYCEHRHDQSCFSMLIKKYKLYCINDETMIMHNIKKSSIPIISMRNRTGISIIENKFKLFNCN